MNNMKKYIGRTGNLLRENTYFLRRYFGFIDYVRKVKEMRSNLERMNVKVDGAFRLHHMFVPTEEAVNIYGVEMVEEELKSYLNRFSKMLMSEGVSDMFKIDTVRTLSPFLIVVVMSYTYASNSVMMRLFYAGILTAVCVSIYLLAALI